MKRNGAHKPEVKQTMIWRTSRVLSFFCLCCVVALLALFYYSDLRDFTFTFKMKPKEFEHHNQSKTNNDIRIVNFFNQPVGAGKSHNTKTKTEESQSCPGVLSHMLSGTWKTRELTSQERVEIRVFVKHTLHYLPNNSDYQRSDLKCGNLTYTGTSARRWFRVLCNPEGPTPCCFHNRCESRTVDECKGPLNYDLRPRVHAEYSTWVPHDKRCSVKLFDSQSACKLLEGATVYVIGESLMRQLYTALLMILTGDFKTGALKPGLSPAVRKMCSGLYMFPIGACIGHTNFEPRVCNGRLKLAFRGFNSPGYSKHLLRLAVQLKGKKKSIMFIGTGLREFYNSTLVFRAFLQPTLQALRSPGNYSYWPNVLWSAAHSLGIWRYPDVKTVNNVDGKIFNEKIIEFIRPYGVPVFNTFRLTEGVRSIDGTHYGLAMNVLKSQIFLNYVQELKQKGTW